MITHSTLTDGDGKTTYYCSGMCVGVDFLDGRPPHEVAKLLRCLTHDGKPVTAYEFRRLADEARAKGYEVFPMDGCTNIRPDGHCGGHPTPPPGWDGEETLDGEDPRR